MIIRIYMYGFCTNLRSIIRSEIFQSFWSINYDSKKLLKDMTEDEIDDIMIDDIIFDFQFWFNKKYSLSCFFLDEEDQVEFEMSRLEMKKNDPDVPDYGILIEKTYGDRFKEIKGRKTSIDRTIRVNGKQTI